MKMYRCHQCFREGFCTQQVTGTLANPTMCPVTLQCHAVWLESEEKDQVPRAPKNLLERDSSDN